MFTYNIPPTIIKTPSPTLPSDYYNSHFLSPFTHSTAAISRATEFRSHLLRFNIPCFRKYPKLNSGMLKIDWVEGATPNRWAADKTQFRHIHFYLRWGREKKSKLLSQKKLHSFENWD